MRSIKLKNEVKKMDSSIDFGVLSHKDIAQIHQATLELLGNTGVEVQEEEARNLLASAGATIQGTRARINSDLIDWAISNAPKSVTIYRRDGKPGVVLEGGKTFFGTGSDCPNILDPYTGERRRFTTADVATAARIVDALPNIDFLMSMGIAQDNPPAVSDIYQFREMILNTQKPIVFTAHNKTGMEQIIRIAEIACGGAKHFNERPSICLYAEPVSPLQHIEIVLKKLLLAAERKIPVVYTPGIMAGGTAPITLAGTLVVSNAEILSGLVIHQLKQPGAPFISGGVITILDMKSTNFSYGAPEFNLMGAAYSQIGQYYGLPVYGTAGCSDSKILDQQAAIEATMSCLAMCLSGSNLVHDVGYLEYGLTASYEMLAMTNEIIGMVRRFTRGIEVNKETLALEAIDRVGPGGNFLADDHTLEHFRSELWFPEFLDRENRNAWENKGNKTLADKLNEKVRDIIEHYQSKQVPNQAKTEIDKIIQALNG